MTVELDMPRPTRVRTTQPVVAVIAEHDSSDSALLALIHRLGFVAVLHDVDAADAPRPGFAVVAVATTRERLAALPAMTDYRMATIVGVGIDRASASLMSPDGVRRLLTVLGDAATHHSDIVAAPPARRRW